MQPYWHQFLRNYAQKSNRGSIRSGAGFEALWANALLPFNNGTIPTGPLTSPEQLASIVDASIADAAPAGLPWLLFLYEPDLSPALAPEADSIIEAAGLTPYIKIRLMTGNLAQLAPPKRLLPAVEFQRVTTEEQKLTVLHINCQAYGVPLEMGTDIHACDAYFSDPEKEFGFIAYVDDFPVSTASVVVLEDSLYVFLVATDPAHRQKGYAEAVMRHALSVASEATGLTRTDLDASGMGEPLYTQMGYTPLPAYWRTYLKH